MIKKKICMIGAFAVGKTSLVQRYVKSIFSEKYLTTIGVKIDQKLVEVNGQQVNLILWDIHGEDEFQNIKPSYLVGSAAYFLVADGTRRNTLEVAERLQIMADKTTKNAPFIILINKADIKNTWEIEADDINKLKDKGWDIIETSAKDGLGVEDAFKLLTEKIIK